MGGTLESVIVFHCLRAERVVWVLREEVGRIRRVDEGVAGESKKDDTNTVSGSSRAVCHRDFDVDRFGPQEEARIVDEMSVGTAVKMERCGRPGGE